MKDAIGQLVPRNEDPRLITGRGTTAQPVLAVGKARFAGEVRTGDTDESLWGFGAFSSRQAVIGGGGSS